MAVLAASVLGGAASASNFGYDGKIFYANNRTHTFFYTSGLTHYEGAVTWSRYNNVNPTIINTSMHQGDPHAHTNPADVSALEGRYQTTWTGYAVCEFKNHPVCNHFHVLFNTRYDYSWGAKRSLACQELGHTLALRHSRDPDSCMYGIGSNRRWFSDHDNRHVNSYY